MQMVNIGNSLKRQRIDETKLDSVILAVLKQKREMIKIWVHCAKEDD